MAMSLFVGCGGNKDQDSAADNTADQPSKDTDEKAGEDKAPVEKDEDKKPGKEVKLKWSTWGNAGEIERFQQFTDDFNKRHKGEINAELIPVPDQYDQKIMTQLASNTAPDLFYSGGESIYKYVRDDRVLDLSEFMNNSETLKPDSIYENLYGSAKQDGKIYGVTVDCNPMIMYYNTDLIKKAGAKTPQEYKDEGKWNWESFAELTRKVRSQTNKHGFIMDNWWAATFPWILPKDKEMYVEEDGTYKTLIDQPEMAEGINFIVDLIKEKAVTYSGSLPKGQGSDAMFMSGQVAMVAAGRWYVPMFKKIKNFEWDIISYPDRPDGETVVGIPIAYFVINKDTKYPQQAFTFLEEFCNKDGQYFRLQGSGNAIPSYKDDELDKVVEEGNVVPLAEQMSPEAAKAQQDGLDLIWLLKDDPEKGLKNITEKVNAEFAKVKK